MKKIREASRVSQCLPSGLSPSGFPAKSLHTFSSFPTCHVSYPLYIRLLIVVKKSNKLQQLRFYSPQWLYSTCFGRQSHPSSGVHMLYMATGKPAHCKLTIHLL